MVSKTIAILTATVLMVGCMYSKQHKACQTYPEVCKLMESQEAVRVIITLDELADKQLFASDLQAQGAQVHTVFDVTPQLVAEIDFEQFLYLYDLPDLKKIQLDQFNLPVTP